MGWARLDDGMHDHPKLIGLSLEALGLWTKCLTWAHRHHGVRLGHIPEGLPATFDSRRGKRLAAELVAHRLWDVEEVLGGWVIHDYVDFLPASEKPESASEVSKSRSEAGKRGAKARWGAKANDEPADSNLLSAGQDDSMPPTRPDQNPTDTPSADADGAPPAKRATRIPEPFIVTREMRQWAAEELPGFDVDRATRPFVDYWRSASGRTATKRDWVAAWRNWLRRDAGTTPSRATTQRESSLDRRNRQVETMFAELAQLEPQGAIER